MPANRWSPIEAERAGLVILAESTACPPTARRARWLGSKTTIVSNKAQTKRSTLDGAPGVGLPQRKLVYSDRNMYQPPEARKRPDGRLSLRYRLSSTPAFAGW